MPVRIAGALSLVCFAACVVAGAFFGGGVSFGTVLGRALAAMACTFGIGLVVGVMARKMLEEHAATQAQRLAEARAAALKARRERETILEVGGEEPLASGRRARPASITATSDKPRRSGAAA